MSRLTVGERILIHMGKYDLVCSDGVFNTPRNLTQEGIATALDASRAHISIELKKLKARGKITDKRSHVRGCTNKRISYHLTPYGIEEARRLTAIAEENAGDIMPAPGENRRDPGMLWDSADDDDRHSIGVACVLRRPVPRSALPDTEHLIPADAGGMVAADDDLKNYVLSVAGENEKKMWHSAAADYWLDRDDVNERLYHLVAADRKRDACRLIANEKERLLNSAGDDLSEIMSHIGNIPEKYVRAVVPVIIGSAIASDDITFAETMIGVLKERDPCLSVLFSADLEMKRGEYEKALEIIRTAGASGDKEADIRKAAALGHLGRTKESLDMLTSMKDDLIRSGNIDGLDRIYILMADVSAASGDKDSPINYLTKALGIATDSSKKRVYGMLASSYSAIGMHEKAAECSSRSK